MRRGDVWLTSLDPTGLRPPMWGGGFAPPAAALKLSLGYAHSWGAAPNF